MSKITLGLLVFLASTVYAGVPVKWTVETSRADTQTIDVYHGETLDIEVTFKTYGKTLVLPTNEVAYTFWQTNGMDTAYWRTNNVEIISTNGIMRSFFDANMDVGAKTIRGFIGIAGNIYRASFVLRFKDAPGFTPVKVEWPYRELDFNYVIVKNPPYYTREATQEFVAELLKTNWPGSKDEIMTSDGKGGIQKGGITASEIIDQAVSMAIGGGASTNWIASTNYVTSSIRNSTNTLWIASTNYVQEAIKGGSTADGEKIKYNGSWIRGDFEASMMYGHLNVSTFTFDSSTLVWNDSESGWTGTVEGSSVKVYNSPEMEEHWDIKIDGILVSMNSWESVAEGTTTAFGDHTIKSNPSIEMPTRVATTNDLGSLEGKITTQSNEVALLSEQVSTIGAHLNAEDARFVSTNYNSTTKIPEAYVEVKISNTWLKVWSEMSRWDYFAGTNFQWASSWTGFQTWKTNLEATVDRKSPREYAFYDGVTGEVAPTDYFWVSQPHVAICAGAAYQRYVDGAHEIWVLESNGTIADLNGTTNGYFRITDSEGDTQFEIVKGDKQTVFANAYAMTKEDVSGVTHYFTTYAVTNSLGAPTARISVTSPASGFVAEDSADCPANVAWTAGEGFYTLEWWPKSDYPQMFVKADYEKGGDTVIRNKAPVSMETIIIGEKKYSLSVTTISGVQTLQLTEVP